MSDLKIVEKIKKLLRLGESSNPNEASLALERAFELAARHKIEVAELDLDEATDRVVSEHFKVAAKTTFLQRRAQSLIMSFFNVDVITCHREMELIGNESDIAVARHVYEIIVREGNRWLAIYVEQQTTFGRAMTTNKKRSFVQGFIYGIAEQLRRKKEQIELEDARFAIVLADQARDRDTFVAQHYPSIRTRRDRGVKNPQVTALVSGLLRGRETKLNPACGGGAASTPFSLAFS